LPAYITVTFLYDIIIVNPVCTPPLLSNTWCHPRPNMQF